MKNTTSISRKNISMPGELNTVSFTDSFPHSLQTPASALGSPLPTLPILPGSLPFGDPLL